MASNLSLELIWQFCVYGLNTGAVYALVALGFVIVYQITGFVNFAQGEFVMLGAMLTAWPTSSLKWQIWYATPFAIIVTVFIGLLLERFCIRPAEKRNANAMTVVVITLGAGIAIKGVALSLWGPEPYSLAVFNKGSFKIFGAVILWQNLWQLGATALVGGLFLFFFTRTLIGRAMRACSINRYAARLMGISPRFMSSVAFGLAAAIGAVGGIVIAPTAGGASWDMGTRLGLLGFVAAVLGGWSYGGAVAGGFLLGVMEQLAIGVTDRNWSRFQDAFAFILLLLVLLWRPGGLFARKARETSRAGL